MEPILIPKKEKAKVVLPLLFLREEGDLKVWREREKRAHSLSSSMEKDKGRNFLLL